MVNAIITNGDQRGIISFPCSRMRLAGELAYLGISTPPREIPCSDDEDNEIQVKIFGETEDENRMGLLISENDSIATVNSLLGTFYDLPPQTRSWINDWIKEGRITSLKEFRGVLSHALGSDVTETYYCPLTADYYESSPTKKQLELIKAITDANAKTKTLPEFKEYENRASRGTVSEFISAAFENYPNLLESEFYLRYIATRPRADKSGKQHGLFSDEEEIDLDKAMSQMQYFDGNLFSIIVSVKREDAERLGYNNAARWRDKGGLAITFVEKFFDKTFPEAIAELTGSSFSSAIPSERREKEQRELVIPPKNNALFHVFSYLRKERCISRDVISEFARKGLLYEDAQYHNCIFVGRDENGNTKHIHRRSTFGSFKQTAGGSVAEHSFHYDGKDEWIFVFEAPIDMLAFITLYPKNWKDHSYVSLCSVSDRALLERLKQNKELRKIVLCLDHDVYGARAEKRIADTLREKGYEEIFYMLPEKKDWDEDLKARCGMKAIPASGSEEGIKKQEVTAWDQSQL